jgi:hypothetical protein
MSAGAQHQQAADQPWAVADWNPLLQAYTEAPRLAPRQYQLTHISSGYQHKERGHRVLSR